MSLKSNPFIGLHSNFDLDSGHLNESGWQNKEILLIRVTEDIAKTKKISTEITCNENKTTIFEDGKISLEFEGDIYKDIDDDIEFNEIILQVKSIDELINLSKDFFSKAVGEFKEEDSQLSDWFDYKERSAILMNNAFNKVISDGFYNHLIPIIHTPFTKEIFQRGELNNDSPSIITSVLKRKLKKK